MKKFILAAGMIFFLAACSNDDVKIFGPNDGAGKGAGGTQSDVFAVSKGTSVDTASFWGTWESQPISISGISMKVRIQFATDRVTAATECIYPDGVKLYAQVSSDASYFDNVVTIYESKDDLAKYENNGKTYTCTASIEKETQAINIISGKIYGDDFVLTKIAN